MVKKIRPEAEKKGPIKHIDGRIIGEHTGIINYTIGQRRGIGIGGGVSDNNEPLYVVRIDASNNAVIVGPKEALARDIVKISDTNWLLDTSSTDPIDVTVKLRSVSNPKPAKLVITGDNEAMIYLDEPQYGISPGQAAVCYQENRTVGGGWIIETDQQKESLAA